MLILNKAIICKALKEEANTVHKFKAAKSHVQDKFTDIRAEE